MGFISSWIVSRSLLSLSSLSSSSLKCTYLMLAFGFLKDLPISVRSKLARRIDSLLALEFIAFFPDLSYGLPV